MTIQEIAKRNYAATKRRGQIVSFTQAHEIIEKLFEEAKELAHSVKIDNSFDEKELADVALVCFTMAEHFNIDLIKVMEEKMLYNEIRKD